MKLLKSYIGVLVVIFLLMPCVFADETLSLGNPFKTAWEPIKDIFDFNTTSMQDLVPKMRFLFWIVIFTISFAVFRWLANSSSGFSWLKGNIAVILAVALSAISAIFVPSEALMAIGATYGEIGILIMFLPVFVGLIVVAVQTKSRVAKIIVLFMSIYMLLYFHNLFQSIDSVDGMKTFTFKDYKINGQPVTVKGIADLITILGLAILPIWLVIEIFLGLTQGFGGGEGGGGGWGFGGKKEGEDGGKERGGGREPTEPERLDVQIAYPRNGQNVRRGERIAVEGVVRGGNGPFRVDIAVDNTRPQSFQPFNTGRRRFVTHELSTDEFRAGAQHQISLHVWDSKRQYAEASVVINFEGEEHFDVRIILPPPIGPATVPFKRGENMPFQVEFIGGSPPYEYRVKIDNWAHYDLQNSNRVAGKFARTMERRPPGETLAVFRELQVQLDEHGKDKHKLTVEAKDATGPIKEFHRDVIIEGGTAALTVHIEKPGNNDSVQPGKLDVRAKVENGVPKYKSRWLITDKNKKILVPETVIESNNKNSITGKIDIPSYLKDECLLIVIVEDNAQKSATDEITIKIGGGGGGGKTPKFSDPPIKDLENYFKQFTDANLDNLKFVWEIVNWNVQNNPTAPKIKRFGDAAKELIKIQTALKAMPQNNPKLVHLHAKLTSFYNNVDNMGQWYIAHFNHLEDNHMLGYGNFIEKIIRNWQAVRIRGVRLTTFSNPVSQSANKNAILRFIWIKSFNATPGKKAPIRNQFVEFMRSVLAAYTDYEDIKKDLP